MSFRLEDNATKWDKDDGPYISDKLSMMKDTMQKLVEDLNEAVDKVDLLEDDYIGYRDEVEYLEKENKRLREQLASNAVPISQEHVDGIPGKFVTMEMFSKARSLATELYYNRENHIVTDETAAQSKAKYKCWICQEHVDSHREILDELYKVE